MPESPIRSIDDVCEVLDLGDRRRAPSLLLEVPHGATRAAHFDEVRARLVGEFPADLQAFFFVNTDVGAPEVARRVAEIVAGTSCRRVLVVRSLVPRTFVDCNRVIDVDAAPRASAAGEVTPGVHVYVRAAADRALLLSRYAAYRNVASAAYAAVCGAGGQALMVHSYAPRSIDVPVDERIVERLRAEYQPERIGQWPLRSEVDLIAKAPDGRVMAAPALVEACQRELRTAGLSVDVCGTYTLHPQTLAHEFAAAYPERTLCLEIRRDLLVPEFTPFAEMIPDAAKVERVAVGLARACGVGVGRGV
ncbi:MAG: N-formylglutamate amidohydrolase [Planctomycetota bacterium]